MALTSRRRAYNLPHRPVERQVVTLCWIHREAGGCSCCWQVGHWLFKPFSSCCSFSQFLLFFFLSMVSFKFAYNSNTVYSKVADIGSELLCTRICTSRAYV